MSRLENLADQAADIFNEARETLTWLQRQRLFKTIQDRLDAEVDRDASDEDEAA